MAPKAKTYNFATINSHRGATWQYEVARKFRDKHHGTYRPLAELYVQQTYTHPLNLH